jgi:hypothetical protein
VPESRSLALAFVLLAVVFAVLAVLYALGTISWLTFSAGHTHHYTHAVVLGVLALVSLVAANFARPKPLTKA